MEPFDLAGNFDSFFSVRIASSAALRETSFRIRHAVYCEELGWEPTRESGLEIDDCDDYALSILLEHRRTGQFAGTVRLVIPPAHKPDSPLPFELNFDKLVRRDVVDPDLIPRGHYGEISRLAVPASFRRRAGEANKPFIFHDVSGNLEEYTADEKRNFPNIAIGLYMSLIAVVTMCHHEAVFVVAEPRLCRRLGRLGLVFTQVSEPIEHHGTRALFHMQTLDVPGQLNAGMLALYELIEEQVARQLTLYPYQQLDA